MDKSAIQQIQETGNIDKIIEQATGLPAAVVPDSMRLVSIESYNPTQLRQRYQFKTTSVADFVQYVDDHKTDTAITEVDSTRPTQLAALTTLDFGDNDAPLHKENKAMVTVQASAAYQAFLANDGNKMSQRDASEFIEDWSDFVKIFTRDGTPMTIPQATESLRNMTIESARKSESKIDDFGESASIAESIEAKNQDQLPAVIMFDCVPFLGFSEYGFSYRVSILTGGDRPLIGLRAMQLESTQEVIAQEFVELIRDGLAATDIPVYLANI